MLLDALSSAASEITRELAPGSVDVRLRGRDLEFVVATPRPTDYADVDEAWSERAVEREITRELAPRRHRRRPADTPDLDDVSTSRTTLRLPDQLKARVDQAAAADGLSVNAWLVRAIGDALEPKNRRSTQRESRSSDQYTGWAALSRAARTATSVIPPPGGTPRHARARPERSHTPCPHSAPRHPIEVSFALQAARLELVASDRRDTVVTVAPRNPDAIGGCRRPSSRRPSPSPMAGSRSSARAAGTSSARPTRSS